MQGRLPDELVDMLEKDGFASYSDGAVWSCDPDVWKDILPNWSTKFPDAEVFLRLAFGSFYFWADNACWFCDVDGAQILFCQENMAWFLNDFLTNADYVKQLGILSDAKRAKKAAGSLNADQCYFWNPAWALGGSPETSNVQKGDMKVSLAILAQIQPVKVQNI